MILNVEVRNIVIQINILRDDKCSDYLIHDFGHEGIVGGGWVHGALVQHILHVFLFFQAGNQIISLLKLRLLDAGHLHVIGVKVVAMHDVQDMLERVDRLL